MIASFWMFLDCRLKTLKSISYQNSLYIILKLFDATDAPKYRLRASNKFFNQKFS